MPELQKAWRAATPFPYIIFDDFLAVDDVKELLGAYPSPDAPAWMRRTYTHQREKLAMEKGFPEPIADFFRLTADADFRDLIGQITGISGILDDPDLVGGGLHQITRGGFLDVHIDFNLHPRTKQHRRLNLLYYLNEDWKDEYEGHLELWDMERKRCVEKVAPILNRAVLFETNEVSYHGHPTPLACPPDRSRRSAAVYYYTQERDVVAPEHNTMYRQTTGTQGYLKTMKSSVRAVRERLQREGVVSLGLDIGDKAYRKLRGLPPRNA